MTSGSSAANDDSGDPTSDVKDKFREALDRKRGNQADREAASDRLGSSKVNHERASARTKRTFRRKSG